MSSAIAFPSPNPSLYTQGQIAQLTAMATEMPTGFSPQLTAPQPPESIAQEILDNLCQNTSKVRKLNKACRELRVLVKSHKPKTLGDTLCAAADISMAQIGANERFLKLWTSTDEIGRLYLLDRAFNKVIWDLSHSKQETHFNLCKTWYENFLSQNSPDEAFSFALKKILEKNPGKASTVKNLENYWRNAFEKGECESKSDIERWRAPLTQLLKLLKQLGLDQPAFFNNPNANTAGFVPPRPTLPMPGKQVDADTALLQSSLPANYVDLGRNHNARGSIPVVPI